MSLRLMYLKTFASGSLLITTRSVLVSVADE